MKRTLQFVFALALAGLLTATAAAQSLGDYARQQRAKKPPTTEGVKEYTNDNLPTSGGALSTVGASATPASDSASTSASAAKSKADTASQKDMGKLETEWKAKFAKQKGEIATLQREMDVSTRENKLRASAHYGNAAERLQHSKQFAEDDLKYQAELKEKQQALADAQQKLEDMKEELRKAGLPSSWAE